MSLDIKYTNKIAVPKGAGLNVRVIPSTNGAVLFVKKSGQAAGRTTGQLLNMSDGIWYQILLYTADDPQNNKYGYVRNDVTNLIEPKQNTVTDAQAMDMVKQLVANDQQIMNLSLVNVALLEKAQQQGKDVSVLADKQAKLIERYNKRQQRIQTSELLKTQRAYSKSVEDLVKKYGSTTAYDKVIDGIGAFPIIAIAAGAIVGIGLAVMIYYAFRPDYDQSKVDLDIAKDINEKIKSVLTPEQYKEFSDKLKKQVADAYKTGHAEGGVEGTWALLKPIALIGFGLIVLPRLLDTATSYSRKGAYRSAA